MQLRKQGEAFPPRSRSFLPANSYTLRYTLAKFSRSQKVTRSPPQAKKTPQFQDHIYVVQVLYIYIKTAAQPPGIYIYVHLYNQPSFLLPETLQPALQRRHKQRHGGHAPRERRGRAEVIAVLRIVHEVSEDLLFRGRRLAVGDLVRDLEAGRKRLRRERGEGSPGVEFTLWGLVSSNSRGRGGREYLSRTHWRVAASIHRSPR